MGKQQSSMNLILKDAGILCMITLIAGFLLGFAYNLTKEPIEKQRMAANLEAYQSVFTDAADFTYEDLLTDAVTQAQTLFEGAEVEFGRVTINEALLALGEQNDLLGYLVLATTKDGYAGEISVVIGMDTEGEIKGIEVVESSETAGLGSKAAEDPFKGQYVGKQVDAFIVTKNGKTQDNEIDAISGATITSRAVTDVVNASIYFIQNNIE